jgi:CRISPR-associated Cas5-like protein
MSVLTSDERRALTDAAETLVEASQAIRDATAAGCDPDALAAKLQGILLRLAAGEQFVGEPPQGVAMRELGDVIFKLAAGSRTVRALAAGTTALDAGNDYLFIQSCRRLQRYIDEVVEKLPGQPKIKDRLKLYEMEAAFEDAISAESGADYTNWLGVPVPPGWALVVDCEGDLVCFVPPATYGHRRSLAEPHPEDGEKSFERARVIATLLNAARDTYPFRDPEED